MVQKNKTVLLCILDGFGVGQDIKSNPIFVANTPTLDILNSQYPNSTLRADGEFVGVPNGQMGNSEVGHITIGTGRVIQQSLVKISAEIENKKFQTNKTYQKFLNESKDSRAIHLIGLLSDGGIHSHIEHAIGLCQSLNNLNKPVFVHAITDGRDTDVNAGIEQIEYFQEQIKHLKNVELVTVIGRFYAMDRDNRWDRTEIAWDLYTQGKGKHYSSVNEALSNGYKQGLSDEHITASLIENNSQVNTAIEDDDSVFLFNFRGDRMRQLSRCLLGLEDVGFDYSQPQLSTIAAMTLYDSEFNDSCLIIYPPQSCDNSLGEVISQAGMKQLRIAETEKYAHVTFFFNNGREEPFKNEDRVLIPSPRDVATYDLKPEMSLPKLTAQLVKTIESNEYDLIVLNIANGDMVGHTGNFEASIKAIEYIDAALKDITTAINNIDGEMIIIADHGNIEQMVCDGKPSTTHTINPVPCIYFGKRQIKIDNGSLANIAPTILTLLNIKIPKEMTKNPLITPLDTIINI